SNEDQTKNDEPSHGNTLTKSQVAVDVNERRRRQLTEEWLTRPQARVSWSFSFSAAWRGSAASLCQRSAVPASADIVSMPSLPLSRERLFRWSVPSPNAG